jgi:membrane-bound lytic murein transglycosylase A
MSITLRVAILVIVSWCWGGSFTLAAQPAIAISPPIEDDLDRASLVTALTRSLNYLQSLPPTTRFSIDRTDVSVALLIDSAHHLRELFLGPLEGESLIRRINQDFNRHQHFPDSDHPQQRLLVTGYYQPVFSGSLRRQAPYLHPLYRRPADLIVRKEANRESRIGRLSQGRFLPYWTRREIEQDNLLNGGELVWLTDPFDAFTLHVQGSGIIRLTDGTVRGVRFAQKNGHPYTSVGKYLVDTGRMQLAEVTMDSIRAFLDDHPQERQQILHQNDSFIFFDWSPSGPAIGSINQELTPGRSVAADHRCYPPGSILLLKSRRPVMANGEVVGWKAIQRLVTVQDTGSAIKGPGRIDIFWGSGEQAGMEAGQMKEKGEVMLLLHKERPVNIPR